MQDRTFKIKFFYLLEVEPGKDHARIVVHRQRQSHVQIHILPQNNDRFYIDPHKFFI